MASTWFSASMLLAILVEGDREPPDYNRVAHIFQADGWNTAFDRALILGRSHETDYANLDGHTVRWRLVRVETIDMLAEHPLDGAEVYSGLHQGVEIATDHPSFDAVLEPEKSRPAHSGL